MVQGNSSSALMLLDREERIEKSGPLGKADVANKELDGVEQQLRAAVKASQQPDGLCMYLLAIICAERCTPEAFLKCVQQHKQ